MVGFLQEVPKEKETKDQLYIDARSPSIHYMPRPGCHVHLRFESRPTGLPTMGMWVSEYEGIEPARPRHVEVGFLPQGYVKAKKLPRIGF